MSITVDDFDDFDFNSVKPEVGAAPKIEDFDDFDFSTVAPEPIGMPEAPAVQATAAPSVVRSNADLQAGYDAGNFADDGVVEPLIAEQATAAPLAPTVDDFDESDLDVSAGDAGNMIVNDALALPRSIAIGAKLAGGAVVSGVARDIALAGKPYGVLLKAQSGRPEQVIRAPAGINDYDAWEQSIRIGQPGAVFMSEADTDFMERALNEQDEPQMLSWLKNKSFQDEVTEKIRAGLNRMNQRQQEGGGFWEGNFLQEGAKSVASAGEDYLDKLGEEITFNREGTSSLGDFIQDVGISTGVSGAAMIPSLVSGNPLPGLAMMKTVTSYMAEDEAAGEGADIAKARRYGNVQGLIEVGTEMLPMGVLFKNAGDVKKSFMKKVGEFLVTEVPTELLATVGQNTSNWLQLNPEKTQAEFWNEMQDDLIHTAMVTPFAGGLQVGGAHLAKKAIEPTFKKIAGKVVQEAPSPVFTKALEELKASGYDETVLAGVAEELQASIKEANDAGAAYNWDEELANISGPFSILQNARRGFGEHSSTRFNSEYMADKGQTPVWLQGRADEIAASQPVRLLNGKEGTINSLNVQPGEVAVAWHNPVKKQLDKIKADIAAGKMKAPAKKIAEMEQEVQEYEDMMTATQGMLQGLTEKFLPNQRVILAVNAEAQEPVSQWAITKAEHGTSGSNLGLGDISVISINPRMFAGKQGKNSFRSSDKLPQTLAHEVGHAMIASWFSKGHSEFPGLVNHIRKAYVDALQLGEANVETFGKNLVAPHRYEHAIVQNPTIDEKGSADQFPQGKYAMGLEEFVAESMVKFALGKQQPRTEAEHHMKDAGKELKALWKELDENFQVNESFAEFAENALKVKTLHDARAARDKVRQRQAEAILEMTENAPQNMSGKNLNRLITDALEAHSFKEGGWNEATDGSNGRGGFSGWTNTEMKEFKDNTADDVTRFNWFMGQTASMLEMVKMNKHIPGAVDYGDASINFWNTKMQWTADASLTLDHWKKHVGGWTSDGNHSAAFDQFLIEADTLSEEKGRLLRMDEMQKLIKQNGLAEADIKMAQEIWAQYGNALTEMESVLIHRLQQMDMNKDPGVKDAVDIGQEIARIKRDFNAMRNRNYMPHSRFGKYSVVVKAAKDVEVDGRKYKKGATISFATAETHRQRAALLKDMKKMYNGSQYLLKQRTAVDDTVMMMQGLPPEMIAHLRQSLNLNEAQNEELDELITRMQPGQGIRKHFLKRKGIAGYENDMMRVYADYFARFANHIARTKHEFEFDAAIQKLQASAELLQNDIPAEGFLNEKTKEEKRVDLLNYFARHREYLMNPGNEYSAVRSVGFLWYLGYVPKSAVVNLTQVPMVVYPYLAARFGDIATTAHMAKAMTDGMGHLGGKLGKGGKTPVKANELEMWQELIERGILDESMVTELAALANDQKILNIKNDGAVMSSTRAVARGGAYLFQAAEKVNRYVTSLAAYRLAENSGKSHAEATQFAWEAVKDTQFEYARFNRPEMMRGAKSVPFLFMQYLTNMMYFVANDPGKWRYLMAMLVLGGYTALPGAENIINILNPIMTKFKSKMGYADPKKGIKEYISEMINDLEENVPLLPDNFSQLMEKGLASNIGGYDLQGSMSMGDILPIDTSVFEREMPMGDKLGRILLSASGAPGEALFNVITAAGTEKPWSMRMLEKGGPTQVKNMTKAWRRYSTQRETDNSGNVIMEFDKTNPYEWTHFLAEASGFPRTDIKHEKEIDFVTRDAAEYYSLRSKYLRDEYFQMRQKEDNSQPVSKAEWEDFDKRLENYNGGVRNLDPRLRMTYGDLVDSWASRKDSELNQQIFGHRQEKFQGLAEQIDTNLR